MKWTLGSLFASRVRRYWAGQYRVWRTALDWTVWLYLLIPGLLFAVGAYRSWWQHPPVWLVGLPDPLAALPPLIAAISGGIRAFAEDADVLFLRQRPAWRKGLVGWGIAYSSLIHHVAAAALFGLLAVWFVPVIGLSAVQLLWWAAFTAACRTAYAIVKHLIGARRNGWRKYAALCLAGAALAAAFLAPSLTFLSTRDAATMQIAAALAWAALAIAAVCKLRARGTFWHDVLMERKAQLASTDFLLSQSVERKPRVQLRKPILFRRSRRLFRRDDAGAVLAEMRLKSFLRKGANLRIWLSFLSVSSTAVLLSPAWLSLPVALVLPGIAAVWLRDQGKEWFAEPFLAQFPWEPSDARAGSILSGYWLLVPSAAWLTALSGWTIVGIWGAAAGLALGAVVWSGINKLFATESAAGSFRQIDSVE